VLAPTEGLGGAALVGGVLHRKGALGEEDFFFKKSNFFHECCSRGRGLKEFSSQIVELVEEDFF
jgi:hypothetical protein